jgi:hypothetical protein
MKYIVETVGLFRMVHVVECENEADALLIAEHADDNWQEHLGVLKFDIAEYSEEKVKRFREKDYFWEGTAYINEDGRISYLHPNGEVRDIDGPKVK